MSGGGGVGGFIATRDEERYAREYPTLLVSVFDTVREGERGFGLTLFEQTSYGSRERGKDWTGNSVYLWTVANAAYMALMGPQGFVDVGELILRQSHYAARRIDELPGVSVRWPGFFKEFVVDFTGTGKTLDAIDEALRERGIFGGGALAGLEGCALYCVTEVHTKDDIDRLVEALSEVIA
jgi:glycine dehydrogenase subunit 1